MMVPMGVLITIEIASGILWLTRMNSKLKAPTLILSPGLMVTRLLSLTLFSRKRPCRIPRVSAVP